uniref:Uncharacterized protein n=1 Tax=Candidatus Nitrotoga fabula TaxID=2182327 RepID=A0A2X0R4H2_9PROT|nr:protein of unknown function [Candidatus Nitrotoga fabula]
MPVSGSVFRICVPVVAPVVRVSIQPCALIAGLVFPVVRIGLHLVTLPALTPGSLAARQGAVGLFKYLRAWFEGLATAGTNFGTHQFSPYEKRMESTRERTGLSGSVRSKNMLLF